MGNAVSIALNDWLRLGIDSKAYPRLPLELERAIFELVALSHPVSIPNLLLVASRVKEWIQPLLYHTLVFDSARPGLTRRLVDGLRFHKPASFFRIIRRQRNLVECAQNLMFLGSQTPVGQLQTVLSACPRVQNLYVLWPYPGDDFDEATLDALPLRRLHCHIGGLAPNNPFQRPFFSNMSHLELWRVPKEEDWPTLARLPRLTHLALGHYNEALSELLLKERETLIMLVVLVPPTTGTNYSTVEADPRFVMMTWRLPSSIHDWQRGVLHGDDYWGRVEDFIARRRAGLPRPPYNMFQRIQSIPFIILTPDFDPKAKTDV
ncbi:hypothetical protein FB45DRAFT_1051069 [Roridomyces roridus]|uniref:Uncharacterized protein n=1 Tax=Roridomyces roridus TaxID=1738132 RepID=A0AAD7CKW8_9AGAR|nr:hypothetical protein FB45DRAFT_1051069 [Roridomyces roridus]